MPAAKKGDYDKARARTKAENDNKGKGFLGGVKNAVKSAISGNKKATTVRDPKTHAEYAKPTYSGMSIKGLTSKDPANVARNRQAALKYKQLESARPRSEMDRRDPARAVTTTAAPAAAAPTAPVAPTMVYTPAPAGYRPGVDPEHQFYRPAPTVAPTAAMKKGGRVKPKRAK